MDMFDYYYFVWFQIGGVVQTILYIDFFYQYIKSRIQGKKLTLPTVAENI
jgi:hypothetical protein